MVINRTDIEAFTEYGYRGLEEIRALQRQVEQLQKRIEQLESESDDVDLETFKLGMTDPD